jgi:hypothetical protein
MKRRLAVLVIGMVLATAAAAQPPSDPGLVKVDLTPSR